MSDKVYRNIQKYKIYTGSLPLSISFTPNDHIIWKLYLVKKTPSSFYAELTYTLSPAFILNYFRYVYILHEGHLYTIPVEFPLNQYSSNTSRCWRPPNSIFYVSPRILEVHKHISSLEVFCYRFCFSFHQISSGLK